MPAPDIDVRAVAWTGGAIAATIFAVIGAVVLLLHVWQVSPGADRVRLPYDLVIEGPALQSAPQPGLAAERASKARVLTTSAWVDDAHGIVRIPVATAMRLLVERSAGDVDPAAARAGPASSAAHAGPSPAAPPAPASGTAGATR
jgi:hypothetical protein